MAPNFSTIEMSSARPSGMQPGARSHESEQSVETAGEVLDGSSSTEHLDPARNERFRDYTTDDLGRRLPAPPHKNRTQLLEQYRSDKVASIGLHWPIRRTQKAARRAQRALQMQEMEQQSARGRNRTQIPQSPAFTEPLFPPLPIFGSPSTAKRIQIYVFRVIAFMCTLGFLLVIILGAFVTSFIPSMSKYVGQKLLLRDPDRHRKFITEERARGAEHKHHVKVTDDIAYYAALQDITIEDFTCETMDGFTLHLQRLYDNRPAAPAASKRYPVLLLHGLLQSSGAFCANDEDSLAFYLCKQGFDVWLGNNRCWIRPEHSILDYHDPRLWAWNIRQLGGLDLPALLKKVCDETGRQRIGFVGHSQGTTQTFCSLSRDQQPEIGLMMDSFCALAPAVYAGALIDKLQFKFMRAIGSKGFRLFFGINAFIPIMMTFHRILPGSWYGQMGYLVFNFLFDWSDALWDRRLKSRFFQFSPVYVSSESMRWWMRDFALFRCILEDTDEVWYKREHFPPLAFWTCGQDQLVNGQKFTERIRQKEHEITVVHQECLEDYAHLDVLWAMDSVTRVAEKVKKVLWACASDREEFVTPHGCDDLPQIRDPRSSEKDVSTQRAVQLNL